MTMQMRDYPIYQPLANLEAGATAVEEIDVSVVIPLLNEAENVNDLYNQVSLALETTDRSYEIIFIDDGSKDNTYSLLKDLVRKDDRILVIRLRRNFGQTAAFSAGFDMSHGEIIVTLDGDLQNDVRDINKLLEIMDEGYDIVSGWRVNRRDNYFTRIIPSRAANWVISTVTGVRLHDYGCSFKAYRRDVIKNIRLYGEMHRFIPAIASWMGVRVAEVPVNHYSRKYGKSKYGLRRTVKVILDLLVVKFLLDFATRPLQFFGLVGFSSLIVGTGLAVYLSVIRLFYGQPLSDRPLLLLAILLMSLGMQLIVLGLLGELIVRTYHESQNKPIYMIRNILSKLNADDTSRKETE